MATINTKCGKCGSSNIVMPDDASESDWITCDDCGERLTTVGEFNKEIARQALRQVGDAVKGTLKGIKGFKPR